MIYIYIYIFDYNNKFIYVIKIYFEPLKYNIQAIDDLTAKEIALAKNLFA